MATDIPYKHQTPWTADTGDVPTAFVRYDQGYDIKATTRHGKNLSAGQNAVISNGTYHMGLWLVEMSSDVALAGSTGQSERTRTFYPRSFTQPVMRLQGQSPTQLEYGRMVEFIHYMQQKSLDGALTTLTVYGRGYNGTGIKGHHEGFSASGYIKQITRSYAKHIYSPAYNFDFIVARTNQGLWQDSITDGKAQSAWADIVASKLKSQDQTVNDALSARNGLTAQEAAQVNQAITHAFKPLNKTIAQIHNLLK